MSPRDLTPLFAGKELSNWLDSYISKVGQKVEEIPRNQFMATSVDTLVEHLANELRIEPLTIYEDEMAMEHLEAKIDVTGRFEYHTRPGTRTVIPGQELRFYLPYSGHMLLWEMRPNRYSLSPPRGTVDDLNSRLVISLRNTVDTPPEQFKKELESQLKQIRQLLGYQSEMLAQYHGELPTLVRASVDRRRGALEKAQGLVATFNIPLAVKSGMPKFRPLELKQNISRPLPKPPASGYEPEPQINDDVYENILSIIRHAGKSFEGAPQTYKPLGEEGLRDNVLSHINVVYEGQASGETFRKFGKTDICVVEDNRSAFIAECKLWGGEKVLRDALEQLLDYLTWRDCKASLVMFNKDVAGFTGVQQKIAEALPAHPGFLRAKNSGYGGEWRFVFQSKEDPAREITVHVFAFNLYVAPERSTKKR